MYYNLGVSLGCIVATLSICRISRVLVGFLVKNAFHKVLVLETISTFELCACVFEIGVIMENYGFVAYAILMFFVFNYWKRNWSPATTTPCPHVLNMFLGRTDIKSGFMKISAQILAACFVYQMYTKNVWGLGYQEKHLQRLATAGQCRTHLQVTLLQGMLIEASCVFALQTSAKLFGPMKYSLITLPLSIVTVKYSGMKLTGAWSNPVLASTIQFGCSGITPLEHFLVYWIGPIIGTLVNYFVFNLFQRFVGSEPPMKPEKGASKRQSKKDKKAKQKGAKAD